MPTGYTAGIYDGEIETFQQFAKRCMRGFGACVHMRDEPLDADYRPQTPRTYHQKAKEKAQQSLDEARSLSDQEIITRHQAQIDEDITHNNVRIKKTRQNVAKLQDMLKKARLYTPPTEDHQKFKEFMVGQLKETIKHDGDYSYWEEKIKQLKSERDMSASQIRQAMITDAKKSIEYHQEQHQQEVSRCRENNDWAKQVFESLK